jgi:hypothetical protein
MQAAAAFERTEQFDAPATPEEARRLRHQVAKTLADWGITDRADDVLSSCAELLTNALAYGQTAVLTVQLAEDDGWLRLAVPDGNPYPPIATVADRDDEDGRGISIVVTLADAWGFRAAETGKSVFAEFRIT